MSRPDKDTGCQQSERGPRMAGAGRRPPGPVASAMGVLLAVALVGLTGGCRSQVAPARSLSPYAATGGRVLWAVAPLANRTGTSLVQADAVTDELCRAIENVPGVECLPLNRTLEAMRALRIQEVSTPGEAELLAMELGVDGLLIGSITSWDPYSPPRLGLSLALHVPSSVGSKGRGGTPDPRAINGATTETGQAFQQFGFTRAEPVSTAALHLDARDHSVQAKVQRYASGRTAESSVAGWREYLLSMDLYTRFAAFEAVDEIMQAEWRRLTLSAAPPVEG